MKDSVLVFGGTFDPIHVAHLVVAEEAADQLGVGRVVFIPAASPPHKSRAVTESGHRAAMLEAAIETNDRFTWDACEIERGGVSFTVDTLRELGSRWGLDSRELFCLVGGDSLVAFRTWREPDTILTLATLAVAGRPGFDDRSIDRSLQGHVHYLETTPLAISSTEIRRRAAEGRSIRYLVTDPVRDYIERQGLYHG
ncbi:MAG: nicotinate-nucleotide adenylyltransferase [Gemmatimonadetes bacterium]|nr:nicotinate-nucleotide adenylyltransferase [Gemmatimonadota bacterium]